MDPRSVLLVDDDPSIRTVAEMSLGKIGRFEVVVVGSGAEALVAVRAKRPDVILLDVMMPGMDGPTTLGRLRADAETASIPVIFLTAKVQNPEVERYLALGATGVIPKPFDPMTLPGEVRRILAAM
jgi:CheY-like chemotaxis protein